MADPLRDTLAVIEQGGDEGIAAFTDVASRLYKENGFEALGEWIQDTFYLLPELDQIITIASAMEALIKTEK
jgi:hypothetical protein